MDLETILKKHNINEIFESAKKMDKENRIFISENYVVKLYYPKKFKYYFNELEIYQGLKDKEYLPKLHYFGEEDNYKYIVISRLKGKSLFDSWNDLDYEQKKSAVIQISSILKDINNLREETTNFKNKLDNDFITAINKLNFSSEFLEHIKHLYYSKSKNISENEMSNLIHIDIHFYNFFIEDNKIYAYDFENTVLGPLDYQLVRWYKMWKYPEKFKYPKNSMTYEEINSYNVIMKELLNNYPEICNNPNLDDRIKLYILVYLLQEASRCNLTEEEVKKYIEDNQKIKLKG